VVYFVSGLAYPDLVVLQVESRVHVAGYPPVVFRGYYLLDVHVQKMVEGVNVLFHQWLQRQKGWDQRVFLVYVFYWRAQAASFEQGIHSRKIMLNL